MLEYIYFWLAKGIAAVLFTVALLLLLLALSLYMSMRDKLGWSWHAKSAEADALRFTYGQDISSLKATLFVDAAYGRLYHKDAIERLLRRKKIVVIDGKVYKAEDAKKLEPSQ